MNRDEAHRVAAVVREGAAELAGPQPEPWFDRLEGEPVREAVTWLLDQGEALLALEISAGVWPFWMSRGRLDEGRELLAAVLSADEGSSAHRARAARGAGILAFRQGDNAAAERLFEESLGLAEELGDRQLVVTGLTDLARIAFRRQDSATVRRFAEQGRALARELGDKAAGRGPLHMLAAAARIDGDLKEARRLYGESIELNRELGNVRMVAGEQHNLGHIELHAGDVERARDLFRASLETISNLKDMYGLPYGIADFGVLAAAEGDLERAARLIAAGYAVFEATGAVPDPDDEVEFEAALSRVRASLDEAAFAAAWEAGKSLSLDAAVKEAVPVHAEPPGV